MVYQGLVALDAQNRSEVYPVLVSTLMAVVLGNVLAILFLKIAGQKHFQSIVQVYRDRLVIAAEIQALDELFVVLNLVDFGQRLQIPQDH